MDEDEDDIRSRVFSELKHYSLILLELLQNPKKNVPEISQLHEFLRKTPSYALQPLLDYAMFPLLLLLDAAVGCRSPQKVDSEGKTGLLGVKNAVSDSVAEGVVLCLEELLKKCYLGSINQMVVVLKKLTYGAMLSPSDASEEFREGIVRCFKALLLRLQPCSVKSCVCNQIHGFPALQNLPNIYSKHRSESVECLLAYLQSQNASAAVGHWLSLLLKIADTEAARGHRGSGNLRVEAFLTLRVLVAKVGTAQALAFFLPGVVSQFTKVLQISKTMISGAAGSTEAIDQAIRGLVEFLMIVLKDMANISGLDMSSETTGFHLSEDKSTRSFVEALRHLPVNSQKRAEVLEANPSDQAVVLKDIKTKRVNNHDGLLCVNRTNDWLKETSAHVDKLLSATFPHLCVHPSRKVRQGLVNSIQGLLSECSYTLKQSRLMLLITASRFMEVLMLCLGQNSVFAGSLDKFILDRPSSVGYLHSIAELRSTSRFSCADKHLQIPLDSVHQNYEVPNMPPWFVYVGSQKLYHVLAGILRLVGLSLMADSRKEISLSVIAEIPLNYLRKLISEVRMKQYSKESWKSWYGRSGSGQLVRQASTAVCILNEIIYGTSDQSVERFVKMFRMSRFKGKELQGCDVICSDGQSPGIENALSNESVWKVYSVLDARSHLTDCIGSILHEYLSPEVWDIPLDPSVSLIKDEAEDMKLHSFHDTAKLHQVIIDGIGTFNVCLGKEFSSSGFLHSSLYLLLENLICSSSEIRRASDAVLHVISATSGYPTVGCLVVSNADYIIDSLCRELRHLDLNPHVPNVIASMLSYVGVANEILPLLEEPMRSVSLELEVLGRHQHPNLTVPFLKGVAEIAKASKCEAYAMPTKAEAYSVHIKSKVSDMEKTRRKECDNCFTSSYGGDTNVNSMETEDIDFTCNGPDMHVEHWEKMLFELNDSKRYRRIVGSIAGSCLTAATPLVASLNESAALVALDIIEDGIAALAKVEEAYRHEKRSKQQIERAIQLCSFHDLEDTLDAADETDENRLLPAMNKIWPYFVSCVKNKNPLVIRRCLTVVSSTVQICGGDFFSRRFHTDGSHFWKMLTTCPFSKKPILSDEKKPLQLPYRISSTSSEDSMSEASGLKVQAAALNMIADLSRNKRSASALDAVLKKISGLVVGIACSGVVGLHDASVNALSGLASIDPDLIWLLLADVYYSLKRKDAPSPPFIGLPEIAELVTSPSSHKEFLFAQYGGDTFGFGVDVSSVEIVFQKMHKEVFTWQKYI
ncbi:hypothetical protein AQUCO_02000317v1 [Aquilegia coerulea]|uniref:Uncharacterized protein n=1 Tax=Aquilegia coerulea TaxID=218851 RepID=A0A2G5DH21_AQUCA|nr:hypothetical protein AQUCO_02000317v1 [Aquilegia coerulea]